MLCTLCQSVKSCVICTHIEETVLLWKPEELFELGKLNLRVQIPENRRAQNTVTCSDQTHRLLLTVMYIYNTAKSNTIHHSAIICVHLYMFFVSFQRVAISIHIRSPKYTETAAVLLFNRPTKKQKEVCLSVFL